MSGHYDDTDTDSEDSVSSDGELEVVVVVVAANCRAAGDTASRRTAKPEILPLIGGPQLSATGGVPADPYSIDDGDDSNDSNDDGNDSVRSALSLKSRLRLRQNGGAAAAYDDDGSDGVAFVAAIPDGAAAGGARVREFAATMKATSSFSSSWRRDRPDRRDDKQEVLVLSSDSDNGGDSDDDDKEGISNQRILNGVSKRGGAAAVAGATNSRVLGRGEAGESDSSSSDDDDRSRSDQGASFIPRGSSRKARNFDDDDEDDDEDNSSTSSSDSSERGIIGTDQHGPKLTKSTVDHPSRHGDLLPPLPPAALASRKRRLPETDAPGQGGKASTIGDYQAKKLQMQRDLEMMRLRRLGIGCEPDDSETASTSTKASSKRRAGGSAATAAAKAKEDREQAQREKDQRRKIAEEFRVKEKERKERERLAKKAAKDAERACKEQNTMLARQAAGRNAKREIAVLMDPGLYHHGTNLYCQELRGLDYHVVRFESLLGCHAIQWIRKDATEGGAEGAVRQLHGGNRDGYTHLPTLCVVFDDPNDFVRLLERRRSDSDDDDEIEDDFPALEKWLRGVEAGWRQSWNCRAPARPRMVLLLHRVPQQLVVLRRDFQARRNGVTRLPPSSEELNDALAWLTVQFRVECVHCSEHKYVNWEIAKITRLLSEEPYQKVYADFDCIAKLPRNCPADAAPYDHARSTWMNQVQQLDGISFDKARIFVRRYPTARSLWLVYKSRQMSEDEKQLLVADLFGEHRREVKASMQLYRLFTTTDPNEIL
jgi:hypothetical protein